MHCDQIRKGWRRGWTGRHYPTTQGSWAPYDAGWRRFAKVAFRGDPKDAGERFREDARVPFADDELHRAKRFLQRRLAVLAIQTHPCIPSCLAGARQTRPGRQQRRPLDNDSNPAGDSPGPRSKGDTIAVQRSPEPRWTRQLDRDHRAESDASAYRPVRRRRSGSGS